MQVDYIKAGAFGDFDDQFETMRSLRPVLLHGLGCFDHAGMKNIGRVDFQRANRLIRECGSPHYGLHLAIENADMEHAMSDEEIHVRMSEGIQIFKRNLSVPLLVENLPDSPQDRTIFDHHPTAEPEKVARLLNENDVGLLLDLTHARVTCLYRKWDVHDFLNALPLDRVKEIHVNGLGYDEQGFPADLHRAMEKEDYGLLAWVLERAHPDIVTLEYLGVGAETPETISLNLVEQLHEINRICQGGLP